MIVDDDAFNLLGLEHLLENMNIMLIHKAYNGLEAIHKVENKVGCDDPNCRKYRIILMDCDMPILNGWDASEILR